MQIYQILSPDCGYEFNGLVFTGTLFLKNGFSLNPANFKPFHLIIAGPFLTRLNQLTEQVVPAAVKMGKA